MKKLLAIILSVLSLASVVGCSSGSSSGGSYKSSNSSKSSGSYKGKNNNSYGFSDYLKDNAPDLYDSIKDRYDSLK